MAEAITALALGAVVAHLGVRSLMEARTAVEVVQLESDRLAALRVARHALGQDLASGERGVDWRSFAPDSVQLRSFRGTGIVCAGLSSADTLFVRWSGIRNPNPNKDSLDVLLEDGSRVQADLTSDRTTATRCPSDPAAVLRRWTIAPAPTGEETMARLWERGSYHLVDGVLSYRSRPRKSLSSKGSRQPVMPAVLSSPESRFQDDAGVLSLVLVGKSSKWSERVRLVGPR